MLKKRSTARRLEETTSLVHEQRDSWSWAIDTAAAKTKDDNQEYRLVRAHTAFSILQRVTKGNCEESNCQETTTKEERKDRGD